MKGLAHLQGDIITKKRKYMDDFFWNIELISTKNGTKHPKVNGIQLKLMKDHALFLKEIP